MNPAKQWYSDARQNWQEVNTEDTFKKYFWGNFVVSFAVYMLIVQWLKYNSTRHGTIINDPMYAILPPHDYSNFISFFTYTAAISTVWYLLAHPKLMHRGFTGFVAIFLIRAICIFLIPLSPSGDLVPLHDPFTNFMANEDNICNDLFFSGHVADLAFFYFLVQSPWLKRYLLICTVSVAVLLVSQRIHYTLDVLAAPFFAYACYWAIVEKDLVWGYFSKKSEDGKNSHSPVAE